MKTKLLAIMLLLTALALAGPVAWGGNVTLSVDSDIPEGTAGHWYRNLSRTETDNLIITADDIANGKDTFKVFDDGGKNGNYSSVCFSALNIYVPDGYVIQVSGTVWTDAPQAGTLSSALLILFNESNRNNPLVQVCSLSDGVAQDFGSVTTTDNTICIYFQNQGGATTYQGIDLTVKVLENTLYNVSVAPGIEHGTVVVSPTTAYYSSDITLTVTPDNNYYIGAVSYNDGTEHILKPVKDVYSFKMPRHDVIVSATFLDEQEYLWGEGNDGTEAKPYVISNKAGWDLLVEKSNWPANTDGKHFRLVADISGVTQSLQFFEGHLDGNHHKITLDNAVGGFIGTASCLINDLTLDGSVRDGYVIYNASSPSLTNCFFNVSYSGNGSFVLMNNGTVLSTNCVYLLNSEVTFAGGNTALNTALPAYLLTLDGGAVAIRTGGTPISDGSVTVYVDGFTFGNAEYYKQNATVTFGVPGTTFASATYNDGSSSYSATINADGSAYFSMPARATTVAVSGYSAKYIDADGSEQTRSVERLTDGETVDKPSGWYVVTGNVSITAGLRFSGDAHLILADGATLTVGDCFEGTTVRSAIRSNGNLSIYGQTLGTGTLIAKAVFRTTNLPTLFYAYGIRAIGGNITLCGGSFNAEAVCNNQEEAGLAHTYAICADGSVSIVRGVVSAVCRTIGTSVQGYSHGIAVGEGGIITLGWGSTTDSIYATTYEGTVKIANGKTLYKGSEALSGTIADNSLINDQTLRPYPENGTMLLARQAAFAGQTRYWATFYHPTWSYRLPAGAQAFTMKNDHALYRVGDGTIVPAGCAVVIMADSADITLTVTDASATAESGNILHGTSEATAKASLFSGNQKVYVMGKSGNNFGFFEFSGATVPANKAYYVE